MSNNPNELDHTARPGAERPTSDVEEGDTLRVPLKEEVLDVDVREKRLGTVHVERRVEREHVRQPLGLEHDDIAVERVPADEVVAERMDPWYEEDTLVIPVYEEIIVSKKQLVLTETVRVTRSRQRRDVVIEDELRRDVVDVRGEVNEER